MTQQETLFPQKVTFEYLKSVIGSGYEVQVADLALRDKVAYRAARKNMQIHSAIILKIDDVFKILIYKIDLLNPYIIYKPFEFILSE